MSCTLEPVIWSGDTGQQIPCFDRCQLIITWMCNINIMAAMLCNSVAVVVVRTGPRPIPLAMITMGKFIDGFPFLSNMGMGLHLAALLAVGELHYY